MFIPQNITTDTFGRLKFWLPQNLPFQAKTYAQSRETDIELLMLVSDFIVKSKLKNTLMHFCRMHGMS